MGEKVAVVPAVVSYGYLDFLSGKSLDQIIAQALGRFPDSVFVHSVGAYSHNTAEATCSELQILIKGISEFSLVLCLQHSANFVFGLLVYVAVKPFLGFGLDIAIHGYSMCCCRKNRKYELLYK